MTAETRLERRAAQLEQRAAELADTLLNAANGEFNTDDLHKVLRARLGEEFSDEEFVYLRFMRERRAR